MGALPHRQRHRGYAFDAFEQPFEDAMEALRKTYGVAEPKHE